MGCKNDILVCVEDQLSEVPTLQRGVEVRLLMIIYVIAQKIFVNLSTLSKKQHEQFIFKYFSSVSVSTLVYTHI